MSGWTLDWVRNLRAWTLGQTSKNQAISLTNVWPQSNKIMHRRFRSPFKECLLGVNHR